VHAEAAMLDGEKEYTDDEHRLDSPIRYLSDVADHALTRPGSGRAARQNFPFAILCTLVLDASLRRAADLRHSSVSIFAGAV